MNKDINFYTTSALEAMGPSWISKLEEPFAFSLNTYAIASKEVCEALAANSNAKSFDFEYTREADLQKVFLGYYRKELIDEFKELYEAMLLDETKYIDEVIFVTQNMYIQEVANVMHFGDGMIASIDKEDNYTGFTTVRCNNSLYSNPSFNFAECHVNEYLVVKDENEKIVDLRKWDGEEYAYLPDREIKSDWFGVLKPRDVYQKMAIDSLYSNQLTLLRGPAGSGKSQIAMAYLMQELEAGRIDKIIMFANPVPTLGAAKLGAYPGSKNDKLLDMQTGNFLASKLGNRDGIDRLLEEEKLMLLPFSDLRGIDTNGMNAGVYITEAQNLDKNLIKLALQRIGDDCICIIDGDSDAQVDDARFSGRNSGICRMSEVFRGSELYGEVTLQNIYRSKICRIANNI